MRLETASENVTISERRPSNISIEVSKTTCQTGFDGLHWNVMQCLRQFALCRKKDSTIGYYSELGR